MKYFPNILQRHKYKLRLIVTAIIMVCASSCARASSISGIAFEDERIILTLDDLVAPEFISAVYSTHSVAIHMLCGERDNREHMSIAVPLSDNTAFKYDATRAALMVTKAELTAEEYVELAGANSVFKIPVRPLLQHAYVSSRNQDYKWISLGITYDKSGVLLVYDAPRELSIICLVDSKLAEELAKGGLAYDTSVTAMGMMLTLDPRGENRRIVVMSGYRSVQLVNLTGSGPTLMRLPWDKSDFIRHLAQGKAPDKNAVINYIVELMGAVDNTEG